MQLLCMRSVATKPFLAAPHRQAAVLRRSTTMSSSNSSAPKQIVEHIVLLKVKPSAAPSAVAAMLANLNSLISLPPVLHISAAPIRRFRSSDSALAFTHVLHTRHRSRSDLDSYAGDPVHVAVVANHIRPVVDDVMAVDWIADGFSGAAVVPSGSAVRLRILKLKEGAAERGKSEVVRRGISKGAAIEQMTVGENISPARAKGYSIGSVAVLKRGKEMDGLDWEMEEEDEEVMKFVDGVLVVDYVTPPENRRSAAAARL